MTSTPHARRRDLAAQNLNPDGTLGDATVFVDRFESGDTGAWDSTVPAP